jgi:putative sigma-54 modulation protein
MIKKLEITGVHFDLDADLKKYVTSKIGKLDKYIPKNARESAHAEIFLKEAKEKTNKKRTCEVVLYLPNEKIAAKETTINMYAAIDIVEAKLKNQIKKYADTHGTRGLHKKVLAKLRNKA